MGQIRQGISENCSDPHRKSAAARKQTWEAGVTIPNSLDSPPCQLVCLHSKIQMYVQWFHCTNTSQVFTLSPKNRCTLMLCGTCYLKLFLQNRCLLCRAFKILKKKQTLTCKWCLVTAVLYSDFSMARYYIAIGKRIIYIGNSLVPINISDDTCRSKNWIPLQLIFKITYSLPLKRGVLTLLFNHAGCQLILPHNTL